MSEFREKYIVTPRYLRKPSKRRSGRLITPGVHFIVAHDTGNRGSTAINNVEYYETTHNKEKASAHIFVDDREIIECIPALTGSPEKAWHVWYSRPMDNQMFGYDANDVAIGVEYCYGSRIDPVEAYRKYIWTIAFICFRFGLDPAKSVAGHFMLDPQRKKDPVTGLADSRRTYEQLLRDIVLEFNECTGQGTSMDSVEVPPEEGKLITIARLNIRKGEPNTRAHIIQTVPANTELSYTGLTDTGEAINGNPLWYRNANGDFFWSGGVREKPEG